MPVPAIQNKCLIAGSQFLHAHQPLAVRAKSKSGRITRQTIVLTGIEKKSMPVIGVEGPELVQETAVFRALGILLDPHLLVGGCLSVFCVQLETGAGAFSTGRRHGGESKP